MRWLFLKKNNAIVLIIVYNIGSNLKTMKKRKTEIKASLRAKKALSLLVENRGSISAAMRAAGYSENTAKNPKNLTESKTWKELMEEYLPESLLAKVHKEGLNASDKIFVRGKLVAEKPDYATRHKYLDSGYKLRGSYAAEKHDVNATGSIIYLPPKKKND